MRGKGWEGDWKANEGEKFENEERNAQERMPQKMQKRKSMWHGAFVCICLTFKVTESSKGQAHHRKKNKDYHLWVIFYIYLQHTKESKPLLVLRAGAGLTIQGRIRVLHHYSLLLTPQSINHSWLSTQGGRESQYKIKFKTVWGHFQIYWVCFLGNSVSLASSAEYCS